MGLMIRRAAALLLVCAAALWATPVSASDPAWRPVSKIAGVFDVSGPRPDGWLIVAGAARLWLVDPQGAVTPFAQGPNGYADDKGAEAYLAVAPKLPPDATGCDFQPGDVYILRLHAPLGITRVDLQGTKTAFATITGVQSLNGIAFDTGGSFGHRLLATGPVGGGKMEVAAIDCNGNVEVLARTAPVFEGGLAVAPAGFGSFAGELIAPDELSGNIYAIAPDGSSAVVVKSGLPTGGDIGVEGVGFVPPGFSGGGSVFYSDRATPGNPHPGTDSLLAMSSDDVTGTGVKEGDLLAVTEGGAAVIGVHCDSSCTVLPVVVQPTRAHGEGHLAFTVTHPPVATSPSPSPTATATPERRPSPQSPAALIAIIVALVALGAGALAVVRARRR
jgi:hypothetical protein